MRVGTGRGAEHSISCNLRVCCFLLFSEGYVMVLFSTGNIDFCRVSDASGEGYGPRTGSGTTSFLCLVL